jgi:hypothetical protein
MITNWFFSLSVGQSLGVLFFGTIIVACITFMTCELTNKLYKWARREYRLSKFPDEFMYRDDPYAKLSYAIDPMRDDIHVVLAKEILAARIDGAPQLSPSNCTCFKCDQQQHCAWAFDGYNTDGDCLMEK